MIDETKKYITLLLTGHCVFTHFVKSRGEAHYLNTPVSFSINNNTESLPIASILGLPRKKWHWPLKTGAIKIAKSSPLPTCHLAVLLLVSTVRAVISVEAARGRARGTRLLVDCHAERRGTHV